MTQELAATRINPINGYMDKLYISGNTLIEERLEDTRYHSIDNLDLFVCSSTWNMAD